MIYQGDFLKLFPLKDNTHTWGSAQEALKTAISKDDSLYLKTIIPLLADAVESDNVVESDGLPCQSVSIRKGLLNMIFLRNQK